VEEDEDAGSVVGVSVDVLADEVTGTGTREGPVVGDNETLAEVCGEVDDEVEDEDTEVRVADDDDDDDDDENEDEEEEDEDNEDVEALALVVDVRKLDGS
jgi:hypothetical protein